MADSKISQLTEDTSPSVDDFLVTVDDPGGTPISKKAAIANVIKVINIGTFAAPITTNHYSLAAANCYNGVLWYGATGEIDLPAAVAGMNIIIYNTGDFVITVDPNESDVVVRDGTAQTGGVSITLSAGAGNYVILVTDAANHLVTVGYKGTLAEGT
ncbi:hypothetical protein KKF61_07930 [Patescibacteria group bacterium]|nr:hypothetical protein [Patescibacteria group bacterium]